MRSVCVFFMKGMRLSERVKMRSEGMLHRLCKPLGCCALFSLCNMSLNNVILMLWCLFIYLLCMLSKKLGQTFCCNSYLFQFLLQWITLCKILTSYLYVCLNIFECASARKRLKTFLVCFFLFCSFLFIRWLEMVHKTKKMNNKCFLSESEHRIIM